MTDGGVSLQEPDQLPIDEPMGIDYDQLSSEEKKRLYPSLIEKLRETPDWNSLPYPYSLRPRGGSVKLKSYYQILSKIRRGMVWDPFYSRMVRPKDKAHWQHDLESRRMSNCEGSIWDSKVSSDQQKETSIDTYVPKQWRL